MANKNLMRVNGQDAGNVNAYLEINLADDNAEVRGFGQPITRARVREIAAGYFFECELAYSLVTEIEANPAYSNLLGHPGFLPLKQKLDPGNQTVSGVFGKEAILQILSLRNCEGIRYIQGKSEDKHTIVLIGVQEDGITTDADGTQHAVSVPVDITSPLRQDLTAADIPIDVEVHKESLTISGVRALLGM